MKHFLVSPDMMCSLMPSERSSAASFLQSNRASFSWGSLDEELDDSLLELSDGEEDDGHFSYTEEEIQELLKDDDLSNSWGGGLQKDDGGHVEKGGRGGAVLLDPAREESSLCSPGPVPRSPGLSKLPQLHASVGLRPTPPKSLNRRFALENNLIKVTVVAPFNPTASDAVHAESKVNSSKITENPSSLREEMRDSPTSSESGPCTESKGVRPINSAQDGPLFSSSHDNIQQTVSDKNLPRSKKPTPISPQISDRPETPTAESTWQNEESQKSSSSETEFSVVSNSPNKVSALFWFCFLKVKRKVKLLSFKSCADEFSRTACAYMRSLPLGCPAPHVARHSLAELRIETESVLILPGSGSII